MIQLKLDNKIKRTKIILCYLVKTYSKKQIFIKIKIINVITMIKKKLLL